MSKPDLCPHCGGAPWFTYQGWQDESRYVGMTLECCAVMSKAIGWQRARNMQEPALKAELRESLIQEWNKRYKEEE